MSYKIAYEATQAALKSDRLLEMVNGFFNTTSVEMRQGCMDGLLGMSEALHKANVSFKYGDEQAQRYMNQAPSLQKAESALAMLNGDAAAIEFQLTQLVIAAKLFQHAIEFKAPTAPQPMPVHVVAMPQRVSHQTVERDKNDEIISTTKIEKDFA